MSFGLSARSTAPEGGAAVLEALAPGPSLPSLPPTDLDADTPPPAAEPEPIPVPINPNTGLPAEPTGEVTETPPWKRRHPNAARRRFRIALALTAAVTVAIAIWAGVSSYLPSGDAVADEAPVNQLPAAGPTDDPDAPTRPAVAVLRDELQAGHEASRFTAGPVASYSFVLVDPFGFAASAHVDVATGNVTATVTPGTEIRRVDGRHFGRLERGPWVALSAEASSSIPPMLLEGPVEREDVLPSEFDEFVVGEQELENATEYVLDDARLAAELPVERSRWLARWGLSPDGEPAEPDDAVADEAAADEAAADDDAPAEDQIVVVLDVGPDGTARVASITSPAIGGTVSYVLRETSGRSLRVEAPSLSLAD